MFYALGAGSGKGFGRKFSRIFGVRRVVHRTAPISTGIPTGLRLRWIFLWIHTAGWSRSPAAPSNAAATSSSRRSLPCGADQLEADRQAVARWSRPAPRWPGSR